MRVILVLVVLAACLGFLAVVVERYFVGRVRKGEAALRTLERRRTSARDAYIRGDITAVEYDEVLTRKLENEKRRHRQADPFA